MGDIRLNPEVTRRCICGNTAPRDHEDCICGEPFEIGMTVKEYKALRAELAAEKEKLAKVEGEYVLCKNYFYSINGCIRDSGILKLVLRKDQHNEEIEAVARNLLADIIGHTADVDRQLRAALKAADVYSPAVGKKG